MNKKTIILVLTVFLVVSFTFGCTNTTSESDGQGDEQQEDTSNQDSSDEQGENGEESSSENDGEMQI